MIWPVLGGFALLAALFVVLPLLRHRPRTVHPETYRSHQQQENVRLYRVVEAELQHQRDNGDLSPEQHAELLAEQQQLLLSDVSGTDEIMPHNAEDASTRPLPESVQQPDSQPLSQHLPQGERQGAWLYLVALLLVPLLAFALYHMLGASDDVVIAQLMEEHSGLRFDADNAKQVEEQSHALKGQLKWRITRRLQSQKDNPAYWLTLGRLQLEDNEFSEAAESYRHAAELVPEDGNLLAEYAQAAYFGANNQFTPVVGAALDQALALTPNNLTALGLQGIRSFGRKDYQQAINSWQAALRAIHPATPQAQSLQAGVQRARKLLAEQSGQSAKSASPSPGLLVKVSLSDVLAKQLKSQIQPNQVVFVFAKAWQGAPMPLAVAKLTVADLPVTLRLDDSMGMPSGQKLSSADKVEVVARVSQTGTVMPTAGDLEGRSGMVLLPRSVQPADEKPLHLVIDQTLE